MQIQEFAAKIGETVRVSDWFLIDQQRIDEFADTTGDYPIIDSKGISRRISDFDAGRCAPSSDALNLSDAEVRQLPRRAPGDIL